MSRLVILLGPMASCLGSIWLVWALEWAVGELYTFYAESTSAETVEEADEGEDEVSSQSSLFDSFLNTTSSLCNFVFDYYTISL